LEPWGWFGILGFAPGAQIVPGVPMWAEKIAKKNPPMNWGKVKKIFNAFRRSLRFGKNRLRFFVR
jgi:hypothetical protein